MNEAKFNPVEQQEKKEWGQGVEIKIKLIRHGDRNKDKTLSDFGREQAVTAAKESGIQESDYDAIKAYGSSMGPDAEVEVHGETMTMGRALETAHIYAGEIDEEQKFNTRVNDLVNFANIKTPAPYDHIGIYNSNLPDNFEELSAEERAKAGEVAQTATVNHAFSIEGPEAEKFRKETAGSFAHMVEHYMSMTKKLKNESKVLLPIGSHSPTMEMLLSQALVYTDQDGQEHTGFQDIETIGGPMQPTDSYNIDIVTDEDGELKDLIVTFDGGDRPQGKMYLDMDKVRELANFYEEIHQ